MPGIPLGHLVHVYLGFGRDRRPAVDCFLTGSTRRAGTDIDCLCQGITSTPVTGCLAGIYGIRLLRQPAAEEVDTVDEDIIAGKKPVHILLRDRFTKHSHLCFRIDLSHLLGHDVRFREAQARGLWAVTSGPIGFSNVRATA